MKPRKPIKRKKRLSRKPKSSRKQLKTECDRLFSQLIRIRDGFRCQLTGSMDNPQCAHLFSRRYLATRWDPLNAWTLSQSRHMFYTHRPLEWDEVLRERLGDFYEPLRQKALAGVKPDLEAVRAQLADLVEVYSDPDYGL